MGMRTLVGVGLAAVACGMLSACAGTADGGGEGGDCVSRYEPVASARSWDGLKEAMSGPTAWDRVVSVRVQERGVDVGAGSHDAVRVVDLLDRNGRRVVQADVWRTDSGGWRAGVWSQCID